MAPADDTQPTRGASGEARTGDAARPTGDPTEASRAGARARSTPLETTWWDPGDDVLEVLRTPAPGPVKSTWRTLFETVRGLATTFGRFLEPKATIEYPEEKTAVYPRFRGRHKLHRFEDTGLEKCVGCSLCVAACPADCIRVVAAENTPEHRVSPGERYAAVYEINMSRCIFCGYCEIACPFDAITMGHDYELSDYDRSDLIFTKEMLLAEPLERTPLRNEGE
jgi:NADH-quinone oxidoreductase subunit I